MSTAQTSRPTAAPQYSEQQARSLLEQILEKQGNAKYQAINHALEERIGRIEDVLPESMRGQAKRLVKRAMLTFASKPDLQGCPTADFVLCVLRAAEMGLAIDGRLCYVVRYKSTWQCQADYKGLVAVAKRSGQIKDAYADVVCEGDQFRCYREDGESHLRHEVPPGTKRGDVLGAYGILKLPDGWRYEWMDRDDLDRIQARAPSKSGPWATDVNEMRKKTVLRRALKLYCDDPGVLNALELSEELDTETREERSERKTETLRNRLATAETPPARQQTNGHREPPVQDEPEEQQPPPGSEVRSETPATEPSDHAKAATATEQHAAGSEAPAPSSQPPEREPGADESEDLERSNIALTIRECIGRIKTGQDAADCRQQIQDNAMLLGGDLTGALLGELAKRAPAEAAKGKRTRPTV